MDAEAKFTEDAQILTEIVLNQKIVEHPTKGQIRLKLPNLEIQRKIDNLARQKKKIIRETTDTIPDSENPDKVKIVPAYKSRETLQREYRELGWWTEEQDAKLEEASNTYTGYLAQLELLGFESEQEIYRGLSELREELIKSLDDDLPQEVLDAVFRLTIVGGDPSYEDKRLVSEKAATTETDTLIGEIEVLRKQYDCYIELAKLHVQVVTMESEKNALFSDSWQDQLQYYIRLAQVFYCTETLDHKSLWNNVSELEADSDIDFVRWIFTELQAFWQGVSDDARERLAKYSFTGRPSEEKSSSEESPATDTSNPDGDLPESEQTPSSEASVTTDQSQTTNLT